MKKNAIKGWIRWMLVCLAFALVAVNFIPIWRIELSAPQYPEGLTLLIYAGKIGGNVDIVNGLNHYIGMKTLHADDFVEFTVLPYIIYLFSAAFIACAIVNRKRFLYALLISLVVFGIIAIIDFGRWEYNYGHDLNPDAAIKVPGMTYQPPLIGYKQLLNFGAYSIPDTGGWVFIGAGVLLFMAVIVQFRSTKTAVPKSRLVSPAALLLVISALFISCSPEQQPIVPGKDECSFCKMTITDARFGGELLTNRGKVYKFDDMYCLLSFLHSGLLDEKDLYAVYLVDFTGNHALFPVNGSYLLKSDLLRSPMNGNIAAFTAPDSLNKYMKELPGKQVSWQTLNGK